MVQHHRWWYGQHVLRKEHAYSCVNPITLPFLCMRRTAHYAPLSTRAPGFQAIFFTIGACALLGSIFVIYGYSAVV